MRDLDRFFKPKSVAVIGATPSAGKIGNIIIENLFSDGYLGEILFVNPNYNEILGMRCYHSITECPGEVDMAVVVVPAKLVPEVLQQVGQKGTKAATIISAGFSEGDAEGKERERVVL